MIRIPLFSADTVFILAPRGAELGIAWQVCLLALLLGVPLLVIVWLCRYEMRLVARWQAAGLLALRCFIVVALWLVIALQPQLAHVEVKESPSRVRIAIDLSTSMDVADPQRAPKETAALRRALRLSNGVDALTRRQIVARLLAPDGANLLGRLAERHDVEIVGFHQRGDAFDAASIQGKLAEPRNPQDILATDLRRALADDPGGKKSLVGVILLSDGRHNVEASPFEHASTLGRQRTPILPIVIGAREPPSDLLIREVRAEQEAGRNVAVPVDVRLKAANLPPQELTVELQFEGKPVLPEHRQTIAHDGTDKVHAASFQMKLDELGTHTYQIRATSKGGEITLANNVALRFIRVTDDKAKVLLVDGEARWEYHYLATALMRDPEVEVERVVFTQPRIGAIKEPELEKLGFAKTKLPAPERKEVDPLMAFDCIFLGDVSPEQLPVADRSRLEKYVAERGGTLILMAGKRHLPMDYAKLPDDPLAKLLPIREPKVLDKDIEFTLRLTPAGMQRKHLHLEPEQPESPWPELPTHRWGIEGMRKPGASVLLAPVISKKGEPTPEADPTDEKGIIVEQSYGLGRVVFVGIDSTWRWRFRVADKYHHRFWGQLVHWTALDKLLPAGNRFVRYGTRAPIYMEGDPIKLAARLNDTLPPLPAAPLAKAKLYRQQKGKPEELVREVLLTPRSGQPNALEADAPALPAGVYRMELDIPPYREQIAAPSDGDAPTKGRDLFRVLPRENAELLDLSCELRLLDGLARASGGKVYGPENLDDLIDGLARRIERSEEATVSKPWESEPMVWLMLGLLLGLLCIEWGWRKWLELP